MADSLPGPTTAAPFALTIGELAERLDLPARDALDDVIDAGVRAFWHEGQKFDLESLRTYLEDRHFFDPVPELDIELTASQLQWLSAMADMEPAVLIGRQEADELAPVEKPVRKFVASQSQLGGASGHQSRIG